MTDVILLDVGHGNCTIVRSAAETAVIDSPTGAMLLDTLDDLGIAMVETAIISHADKDHIAGILSLLTSDPIRVARVFVNPDGQKNSKIWNDFRVAVADAEQRGTVQIVTSLSTSVPGIIVVGDAEIAVLSPSAALALTAVGGKVAEAGRPAGSGKTVTSNTLSAVLRIRSGPEGSMLLAADMDEISLDAAIASATDLSADVLVFPHHGGLPGTSDPEKLTKRLLAAVGPQSVIFSNGRGGHDTPRPEIVKTVRGRDCTIACTQLSARCQAAQVEADSHLETLRASGRKRGACCAGSMTFGFFPRMARIPGMEERHHPFGDHADVNPLVARSQTPTPVRCSTPLPGSSTRSSNDPPAASTNRRRVDR